MRPFLFSTTLLTAGSVLLGADAQATSSDKTSGDSAEKKGK